MLWPLTALADRLLAATRGGNGEQLLADRLAPYTIGARLENVRTRYGAS